MCCRLIHPHRAVLQHERAGCVTAGLFQRKARHES